MMDPVPVYVLLIIGALMLASYRLTYGRAYRLGLTGVGDVNVPQAQPKRLSPTKSPVPDTINKSWLNSRRSKSPPEWHLL